MPKYKVTISPDATMSEQTFTIEANTEEEAMDIAEESYIDNLSSFLLFEFDVEEESE